MILRKTEWVILDKKNTPNGLIDNIVDKSFYQRIIDPIKLMKKAANEIWERTSLWFFIFFIILVLLLIFYAQLNKYFSSTMLYEIGTIRNYAPLIIYFLTILITYFLFAFRMPSITRETFVNEKNINKIILNIQHDIINEKEADLIEKNLSDLAESAKRRKILIRLVTIAAITYMFRQGNEWFGSSTILTFIVAVFFEMYALGSKAIFANAKYAVREISLQYSNAKNNLQLSIENIDSHAS